MQNYLLFKEVLLALVKTSVIMIFLFLSPFILFFGFLIFSCFDTTYKEIDFKKNDEKVLFASNVCEFCYPTHKLLVKLIDKSNVLNNVLIEEYYLSGKYGCSSFYYKKTDDTLFIISEPGSKFSKNKIFKQSKSKIKFIYENVNFKENNSCNYEKFHAEKN